MKVLTTISRRSGLFLLLAVLSLSLVSCSSSRNEESDSVLNDDEHEKNYIFSDNGSEWKVKMENDKITELYRDDSRIPDSEIPKYESRLTKKIQQFEEDMDEFQANMERFHEDMKSCNQEMADLRKEIQRHKFVFDFNTEQFQEKMKEVSADIQEAFASAEFRESMEELQENMKNIHVNINMDEMNAQLEAAREQLKNINVNVDLSDLNVEMADLTEELKDLKIDLKEVKNNVKKFNRFIDDLRNELAKDGLISSPDEEFEMNFNSKEIIIDGKKAPAELHKKYKKMYEDQLGPMNDDMDINTHE